MKLTFIDPRAGKADNSSPLARLHSNGKLFFNVNAIHAFGLTAGQEYVIGTDPADKNKIYLLDADELAKNMGSHPPSVELKSRGRYQMLSLRYVCPQLGIDPATTKLVYSVEMGAKYKGVTRVIVLTKISEQKRVSTRPGRNALNTQS